MRSFFAVSVLMCGWFCGSLQAAQVRVKVLAPDGQPVPNATIWTGEMGHLEYSEKDNTLHHLTTGADGGFTFDLAETAPAAFVRVQATGFSIGDTVLKAGDGVIHLAARKTMSGTVKDIKGVTVADVPVRLLFAPIDEYSFGDGLQAPLNMLSLLKWSFAVPTAETRSDAEGKWALEDVSRGVVALQDPRFAPSTAFSGLGGPGQDKPLLLIAKQGADIHGKLLTPDGKPLAGVFVLSGDFFGAQLPRTDAEGAFILHNIASSTMQQGTNGVMVLMGISLDDEWLIPPLIIQKPLVPGQINEAPKWKAERGIELTGQLVDAKTKNPISKANIGSSTGKAQTSDAEGRFSVRVSPPQAFLSVSHPDYVNFWKQVEVPAGATKFDMGRVLITPSLTFKGRLVDEKGAPAKSVALTASYNADGTGERGEGAITGDDGTFTVKVPSGTITLSLNEEWEAVSPTALKIELTEKTAPIELKIRKLTQYQVKGRVVTSTGKGVSGASVTVNASRPRKTGPNGADFTSSDEKPATTDAEGRFTATFSGKILSPKVTKVEAEGYFFRKATETKTNGLGPRAFTPSERNADGSAMPIVDWPIADTLVMEMNASASGRVLEADGTPASGALVFSPEAAKFSPIKADENGHFSLKNLPEGEITLLAAHGRNFARAVVKAGAEAEIRLTPSYVLVPSMQRQLFAQILKDRTSALDDYWNAIEPEKLLALALQKDGALPPGELDLAKADWSKAETATFSFLSESARRDPAWLLKNGANILTKAPQPKDSDERFQAEAAFAAIAALKGDDAARNVANEWLTFASAQKDKPNKNVENATRLFRLAGVARALGHKSADTLQLAALAFAQQAGKQATTENAYAWGASLGFGGPESFKQLDEWPIEARVNALFSAVQRLAPIDSARAALLLDNLKALSDDAAFKKHVETGGQEAQRLPQQIASAERLWRQAQIKADVEVGAKWVEAQPGFDWGYRVQVARLAWQQKKFEVATRLIRPALEQGYSQNGDMAYLGALARDFDADLSTKLFAKAEELASAENNDYDYSGSTNYGFYRAQDNPALARLWLENAWLHSKNLPKENQWVVSATQNALGGAMVALDPIRALEMIGEAPSDDNRSQARARIAAYLLADETQRPTLRAEND